MAIVLRFVDIQGFLRECFFGIVHVSDTNSSTLKKKIVMCSLDITCISSIYNVKGMMMLVLYVAYGTDYEFYFLEIALIHIMYIALPIDYN